MEMFRDPLPWIRGRVSRAGLARIDRDSPASCVRKTAFSGRMQRMNDAAVPGGRMGEIPITIACGSYDRTRPIMDGRVRVEGCAVTCLPLYPEEIFFRAFRYHEFDVCELSFSSYLRTVAAGTSAYMAVPAFVSRIFRHSGIYIRRDAGIAAPAELRGKRVGLPEYQITAVVWMRGMLQHEYGVAPQEIRWRSGGQEEPGRRE